MIVNSKREFQVEGSVRLFENDRFRIYWKGIVYIPGILSGNDSIKVFLEKMRLTSIQSAVELLWGHFFLYINDLNTHTKYLFTDNSGVFKVYYSGESVSTSFLELGKYENMTLDDFDSEAIIQFLNMGHLAFDKTFFRKIKSINRQHILSFNSDGSIVTVNKNISDKLTDIPKDDNIINIFEQITYSLSNRHLSIDLTGGIDSRMITLLFDHFNVDFENAVSGNYGNTDIKIAKHIAEKLKRPFYTTYHSVDNVENDFISLHEWSDGLINILNLHRLYQFHTHRLQRDIDLFITGTAAEILGEHWFLQDFPLYWKKKSNIHRLFDLRLLTYGFQTKILSDKYKLLNNNFAKDEINKIKAFTLDRNTKTYDNIFYNYNFITSSGYYFTSCSNRLLGYAPFLEIELYRIGFHLQRRIRFFELYRRKLLSKLNSEIASIPTHPRAITLSTQPTVLIFDIIRYGYNKLIRLTRRILQKAIKKTYFIEDLNHPEYLGKIQKSNSTKDIISFLKEIDVLNQDASIKSASITELGNIITLGLTMKYFK